MTFHPDTHSDTPGSYNCVNIYKYLSRSSSHLYRYKCHFLIKIKLEYKPVAFPGNSVTLTLGHVSAHQISM